MLYEEIMDFFPTVTSLFEFEWERNNICTELGSKKENVKVTGIHTNNALKQNRER